MKALFLDNYPDYTDTELVNLAIDGDKKALQVLIVRHQLFVYNLALKMVGNVADAEDVTQEVFIKVITALSKFKGESKFTTWLYRITVNHFINSKKQSGKLKQVSFDTYFNTIDAVPNYELNDQEEKELKDTIEEIRINCTTGMLLCLSKEQRMIYILGEMFEIDHNLGAEILGITPGNFRIKLMRTRKELYNWMNKKCGLVNRNNPCRCSKKTRGYIEDGKVDPSKLQFNTRYTSKISALSKKKAVTFTNTVDELNKKVFQSQPAQTPIQASKIVDDILNNDLIKSILNF
ncbi:RNA polymerase sigma factor [Cellulophaga sp. HaHaR_3_176]|uniref:RNA polymerase sigma factor n=1 Tax=Cellulophaga sp. HaHaR_3_176 TaxID=1942464 RepID=UPI001C1FAA2C|nr:RNA polymerase sigma factor [Cellulophaga sp. HaHaR_3_176]QWX85197.1 RNA polymerase sigma factor [Cellulophaga sp. HaHaR_3_176]